MRSTGGATSEARSADLGRGRAIAADTGRERLQIHLALESSTSLVELGELDAAQAAADEGVERARLMAHAGLLTWAHSVRSSARLAAGEVQAALEDAREATRARRPARARGGGAARLVSGRGARRGRGSPPRPPRRCSTGSGERR